MRGCFLAEYHFSNETDDDPSEVDISISITEWVDGTIDVTQSITHIVYPQRGTFWAFGHYHHQHTEWGPTYDVTG